MADWLPSPRASPSVAGWPSRWSKRTADFPAHPTEAERWSEVTGAGLAGLFFRWAAIEAKQVFDGSLLLEKTTELRCFWGMQARHLVSLVVETWPATWSIALACQDRWKSGLSSTLITEAPRR